MSTDFYLILDTNAYRKLVHERSYEEVREIASLMNAQNNLLKLQPLIEIASCMELISHVLDKNRHCESCRKSILLMSLICSHELLIPTPELKIAQDYFGILIDYSANLAQEIAGLALEIAKYDDAEYNETLTHDIEEVKKIIYNRESQMREDLKLSIKENDKQSTNWQLFQSDSRKRRAYLDYLDSEDFLNCVSNLQLEAIAGSLSNEKKESVLSSEKVDSFLKDYPSRYKASLEMQKVFLEKFINCNFDLEVMPDRVNYYWDSIILHSAGQLFKDKPIVIVSDDKDLLESAKKTDALVWSIDEYLSKMNLN